MVRALGFMVVLLQLWTGGEWEMGGQKAWGRADPSAALF